MHIEEPATHKPEAPLSVPDSQSFPESKDLSPENLILVNAHKQPYKWH